MTWHFSGSIVATVAGEIVNVGYIMQGEIFIVHNFVNLGYISLLCKVKVSLLITL